MKTAVLTLLLSLLCTCVSAQTVVDDFEDGDLLNPEWTGDLAKFVVLDGRLRLLDQSRQSPAKLVINLPAEPAADTLRYEFLVDMQFAPSASNFAEIALLDGPADFPTGVFLRFGGISGDQDALNVSFVEGGDVFLGEFASAPGTLGTEPAIVRFRLQRILGIWSLAADFTGGREFAPVGQLTEPNFITPDRLELTCTYTSTRFDKFSFDDLNFYSSGLPDDTTAPTLTSARATAAREITLDFSEPVASAAISNPANYLLSLPAITVLEVTQELEQRRAVLRLSGDLPLRESFEITVAEASDLEGNVATNLRASLRYNPVSLPSPGNLIITEFMADPTPPLGLPDGEYLEIYNPSDLPVVLASLRIASGGTPVVYGFPDTLAPGAYQLLIGSATAADFAALGIPARSISLPSLTNSGDVITLSDASGTIIQEINYTIGWYNDADRDDGGYSIEYTALTGADAGCSGRWRASLDPTGGTPGRANSVLGQPADTEAPLVVLADIDPDGITIGFSEPVPETPAFALANGPTITAVTSPDGGLTYRLGFAEELVEGVVYTLTIPGVSDCAGNPGTAVTRVLGIAQLPAPGEVVINEILFNPASGGSDFVELYNCSDKVFQIEGWVLRNDQSTSSTATRTITATRLFLPGEYLVLTEDPEDVQNRFRSVNPDWVVDQTLPSLPDDEGNISVVAGGTVLDAFDYTDDLHSPLLDTDDGVSLERLRQKSATQDNANWASAAAREDFGTPTRPNSQARDALPETTENVFSLLSTTFSPDGDGNEDFLELQYATAGAGYLARVRIFDAQGRLVKTLRRVELLGSEGTLRWDGTDEDQLLARAGVYVLFVELFNPNGDTAEEKLVGVLAR